MAGGRGYAGGVYVMAGDGTCAGTCISWRGAGRNREMTGSGRETQKNRKWLWTAAVLCYIGLIYLNSLTPADLSSRQSGRVLVLVWDLLDTLGLDGSRITEHIVRKAAHFTEYTFLGVLLWNCIRSWQFPVQTRVLFHGWAGVLVPLADETLQLFTEGRSGQVSDVWLDIAGICFGTMVTAVLGELRRRRGRRAAGT